MKEGWGRNHFLFWSSASLSETSWLSESDYPFLNNKKYLYKKKEKWASNANWWCFLHFTTSKMMRSMMCIKDSWVCNVYCRREKVNVSRFFVSVKCPNIYILIQAITASSTPLQNKGTYSRSWPFSIQTWSEVCAGKSSLVPLTSIPFPSQDVTTTHFQFPEWTLLLITLLWTAQESF